jgi:hypothetical protein
LSFLARRRLRASLTRRGPLPPFARYLDKSRFVGLLCFPYSSFTECFLVVGPPFRPQEGERYVFQKPAVRRYVSLVLPYSGVVVAPAPKISLASTAGPPFSDDDLPLARSSKRARPSKSIPLLDSRSLRSGQKLTASGRRQNVVVSDNDSDSPVEVVSASKPSGPSLGDSATCVPVDQKKEARRLASGRPRLHEGKSSKKAARATSPAPDAVSAEVLDMLPKPRQLVCSTCLSVFFHI